MRTALCISGLPRHVEKGFQNIKENLIDPNNPDIFIHSWVNLDNEHDTEARSKMLELYGKAFQENQPVLNFQTIEQLPFKNNRWNLDRMMASHGRSYERDKFVEMLYSSWYSVQRSNLLKETYQLRHGFTYDCVIRARFDISYSKPVVVADYSVCDFIHIPDKGLPPEMTDDRFAFGSNDLMNAYCSAFNLLDLVHKRRHLLDGIFCGETLIFEMLKMYGIQAMPIVGLNCGHVH